MAQNGIHLELFTLNSSPNSHLKQSQIQIMVLSSHRIFTPSSEPERSVHEQIQLIQLCRGFKHLWISALWKCYVNLMVAYTSRNVAEPDTSYLKRWGMRYNK